MDEQFVDSPGATPSRLGGISWFLFRRRERWRPTAVEVRDVAVAAVFLLVGIAFAVVW
ncbi:hypothetical protein ACFV42_23090 [Streptomyces solisilvae]|uniref:hypothetical protein n=1 Tax=Streptomyces malaysiensis TaxID=92644 RepID=UPI0036C863B8